MAGKKGMHNKALKKAVIPQPMEVASEAVYRLNPKEALVFYLCLGYMEHHGRIDASRVKDIVESANAVAESLGWDKGERKKAEATLSMLLRETQEEGFESGEGVA